MTRRTLLERLAAGAVAMGAGTGIHSAAHAQAGRGLNDAVADAERAFADTMASRDLAAFTAHISPEAIFFGGPDGNTPTRGRAAIVEAWKPFFEGSVAPFSWTPDTSEVIDSGTLGITSGPVRNAKGDLTGRFNSVWRRDSDGQWRVVFDKGCRSCR